MRHSENRASHLIERELAEYELCDLILRPLRTFLKNLHSIGSAGSKITEKTPYGVKRLFITFPKKTTVFRVIYVGQP